jgi:hypothetical protein
VPVDGVAVAIEVLVKHNALAALAQKLGQLLLACFERLLPQIVALDKIKAAIVVGLIVEQVEKRDACFRTANDALTIEIERAGAQPQGGLQRSAGTFWSSRRHAGCRCAHARRPFGQATGGHHA